MSVFQRSQNVYTGSSFHQEASEACRGLNGINPTYTRVRGSTYAMATVKPTTGSLCCGRYPMKSPLRKPYNVCE